MLYHLEWKKKSKLHFFQIFFIFLYFVPLLLFLYFFSFLRKLRLNEIGKEIKNTRKFLIFECKKFKIYIINIKRLETCGLIFHVYSNSIVRLIFYCKKLIFEKNWNHDLFFVVFKKENNIKNKTVNDFFKTKICLWKLSLYQRVRLFIKKIL